MSGLAPAERDCVGRYCGLLADRLGADLLAIRMFGSAARGDMWPESSPMHSDIDLFVVTARELTAAEEEQLLAETYELYLECGRQISPHFVAQSKLLDPHSERIRQLLERVRAEGVEVWPAAG
jgi:predicted nucleotidyltransferase